MRNRSLRVLVAVAIVFTLLMIVAASASALTSTSKYVKGTTTRVIWDNLQSQVYKINVTHIGTMHVELYWKNPNWADFDVYILDPYFESVYEEGQGYEGLYTGKEVIDHYVDVISPEGSEIVDPTPDEPNSGDEHLRGDDYYVVVVAFNEKAKFQVWGYAQQTDITAGTSPSYRWNMYTQRFRRPGGKEDWGTLQGARYGGAYDFRITSEGQLEARLEWPADLATNTVIYDPVNEPKPCEIEQYVFSGGAWNSVIEHYGKADNWKPKQYIDALGNPWWGLRDLKTIVEGSPSVGTGMLYHYVPSLVSVAQDPMIGQYSGPKLGDDIYSLGDRYKASIGIKATLIYPEHLRISKAPSKVKKGTTQTFKGTYALIFQRDPDNTPGTGDEFNEPDWAGAWTVKLQWSADGKSGWSTKKTVTTAADGTWSTKAKVSKTGYWRARAVGIDATGMATEFSANKRVRAY